MFGIGLRILKGWTKYLFGKKSDMAKRRLLLCDSCRHRKGYFCGKCGCVLVAKAEVQEEVCPAGYW